MRFTSALLVLSGLLYLSCNVCSKKVSCPGFDDKMLTDWFPYDASTKLTFTSGSQLQVFTLSSVQTSQPYSVMQNKSDGCLATRDIISAEQNIQPLLTINLQHYEPFFQNGVQQDVSLALLGLRMKGTNLDNDGFSQVQNLSQGGYGMLKNITGMTVNGKQYGLVQKISFDTGGAKKPPVYTIYISRLYGIIAYQTLSPDLLWELK